MRAFVAALFLFVSGCAGSSSPTVNGGKDGGGGNSICPAHPGQCGGTCCGDQCIDTTIDPRNCGACGMACAAGLVCQAGHCGCFPTGVACGSGQSCCSSAGCKSLDSDANNCGGCGISCGTGGTCTGGQCTCGGAKCSAGQSCCSGMCTSMSCVNDMGMPIDMTMPTNTGLCQCSDHCVNDLFGICMDTNCCYLDALLGSCGAAATCTANPAP
jgi:hypothetical protein